MCPLKVDLLSVTFDPETAVICWFVVTHTMKILLFSVIAGLPTQRPLNPGQTNFASR